MPRELVNKLPRGPQRLSIIRGYWKSRKKNLFQCLNDSGLDVEISDSDYTGATVIHFAQSDWPELHTCLVKVIEEDNISIKSDEEVLIHTPKLAV